MSVTSAGWWSQTALLLTQTSLRMLLAMVVTQLLVCWLLFLPDSLKPPSHPMFCVYFGTTYLLGCLFSLASFSFFNLLVPQISG